MDENNSLDFLLFPGKRTNNIYRNIIYTEKHQNLSGNNIVRNYQKKISRQAEIPYELFNLSNLEFLNSTNLTVNKRYQNIYTTIQSSGLTQENSFKRQNERRFSKRKQRVNHYIKKTEINNSCNNNCNKKKYENIFTETKQITGLLNMDKNRRKGNKMKTSRLKGGDSNECLGCECSNCKREQQLNDVNGKKSRVTIFGQLGLTQDDRYVLNCAATLNDKPIQSNYMDQNKSFYQHETNNDKETKATQATQVNFNFSKQKTIKGYKNKTVQCCCNRKNCESMVSDTESEDIELKKCQSPLVVISVYPRQDSEENIKNNPVKIIHHQPPPHNKMFSRTYQINNVQVKRERKPKTETTSNGLVEHKFIKSRSPSPACQTVKAKNRNTDSKTRMKNRPKPVSPPRQSSPNKSVNKSNDIKQNICYTSKSVKESDFQKEQCDVRNSNKEQVKKALVNTFLKKNKLLDPTENTSKITIDINGDKEQYNVLFEKRNFDTGLTVRKTVKAQSHKKDNQRDDGKLIKKLLLLSDNEDKESCKGRLYSPQCRINPTLLASESRLKVKDSLEIFHRREDRNSSRLEHNPRQTNSITNQSKHFRGDNCSVTDPDERDKEIRRLLGVLRDNRYQDQKEGKICTKYENGDCCIHNPCVKELTIKTNSPKFPSCQVLTIKIKKPIQEVQKDSKFGTRKVKNNIFYVQTKTDDIHNSVYKKAKTRLNKLKNLMANDVSYKKQNFISSVENEKQVMNWDDYFKHNEQIDYERPIILTKKQYDKVKRIIKCTVSKKLSSERRKRYSIKHCNVVSIGNIKVKRKTKRPLQRNCEVQTEIMFKCTGSQYDPQHQNKLISKESDRKINDNVFNMTKKETNENNHTPRHAMSSVEIRYASVGYIKHVSISSLQFEKDSVKPFHESNVERDDKSLRTIFKGPRKRATPNLGTSVFSLNSDSRNGSNYSIKPPPYSGDCKIKKPFLQRLLSCLVMRSPQSSDLKDVEKRRKAPIQNGSLDSYFISTSLCALEMSSSIYDTSASFYSNHSIIPINKTKRGFFNSVRGFLTIKKN